MLVLLCIKAKVLDICTKQITALSIARVRLPLAIATWKLQLELLQQQSSDGKNKT